MHRLQDPSDCVPASLPDDMPRCAVCARRARPIVSSATRLAAGRPGSFSGRAPGEPADHDGPRSARPLRSSVEAAAPTCQGRHRPAGRESPVRSASTSHAIDPEPSITRDACCSMPARGSCSPRSNRRATASGGSRCAATRRPRGSRRWSTTTRAAERRADGRHPESERVLDAARHPSDGAGQSACVSAASAGTRGGRRGTTGTWRTGIEVSDPSCGRRRQQRVEGDLRDPSRGITPTAHAISTRASVSSAAPRENCPVSTSSARNPGRQLPAREVPGQKMISPALRRLRRRATASSRMSAASVSLRRSFT